MEDDDGDDERDGPRKASDESIMSTVIGQLAEIKAEELLMSFVADEKKRGKNGLSEDEGFDDGEEYGNDGGDDDRDSGDSSWRSSLVHGEDTDQDGVLMVDFCYIGSETGASVAGGPQPSRALLAASAAMQR